MSAHEFLDDDLRDRAALFVLASLSEDEARRVRLHLPHCDVCRVEVESLERTARELVLLAPSVEPPRELWTRVLERVRTIAPANALAAEARTSMGGTDDLEVGERESAKEGSASAANAARAGDAPAAMPTAESIQVWRKWMSTPAATNKGFTFLARDDEGYQPTPIPGIHVRRLSVDVAEDRVTMLVRMAPGASYPRHIHGGPEECLVLTGDLHVGDSMHMHAGDFQRAEKGALHEVQWTEKGCTLFIVSSLRDELVA